MSELEQSVSSNLPGSREDGTDRREVNFKSALHSSFRKRRVGPRRDAEVDTPHYVDIHNPIEVYVVILAITLSVMDCFFTLTLIQHGSEELNPIMDYFLQRDVTLFFVVKFCITSFGLLFLIMHKKFMLFNIISGFQLLVGSLVLYTLLVSYELSMLVQLF